MGITKEEALKHIKRNEDLAAKHDLAGIMETYTDDAVMLLAHEQPCRGKSAIEAYFKKHWESPMASKFKLEFDVEDVADSGELAVVTGTWVGKFDGNQGDHGNYVTVLKHHGDDWKVWRSIWNSTSSHEDYLKHLQARIQHQHHEKLTRLSRKNSWNHNYL